MRIDRSILLKWASLFDEFVDDDELVADNCVSWIFDSSKLGVTHSTPAWVAWTSDSIFESKIIFVILSF